MTLTGAGFNVAMAFLAPLALKRNVPAVRGFFIAYTVSALAIRLGGGSLTYRLGLRRTAAVGMVVYGTFIAGLAGLGPITVVPLGIGFGLAHGVLFPALMALLLADVAPAERAKLAGYSNGVLNLGMFSVLGFGQLANHAGLPAVFVLTGAMVAFSAWLFAPRRRRTSLSLHRWSQSRTDDEVAIQSFIRSRLWHAPESPPLQAFLYSAAAWASSLPSPHSPL